MDPKIIKKQEKLLLKQKENLEKELKQVSKVKKTGQKYEPKFVNLGSADDDSAQEVATYEEFMVMEKNLFSMLQEVEKALTKIKKGKYGVCESCKKYISVERLEAFPNASKCLDCAKKPKKKFRFAFWKKR